MINCGATVLDHLSHGSFFHASGGSVKMGIAERLKLIPYESLIGLTLTIISTLLLTVIYRHGWFWHLFGGPCSR